MEHDIAGKTALGEPGASPTPPAAPVTPDPDATPPATPSGEPPAAPVPPADPGTAEPAPAAPEPPVEPGSEPSGAEKRIRELAAKRSEERRGRERAEQEAAYWRGVAEGRIGPNDPVDTPDTIDPNQPPVQENFETYEDYITAKVEWNRERKEERKRIEDANRTIEESAQRLNERFNARIREASESEPELMTALSDPTFLTVRDPARKNMSIHIATTIKESDVSPKLVMYYHKNRAELDKLYSMSPYAAAAAIGRVEAALTATPPPPPPPPPAPKPNHITQAPPPIDTVSTTGGQDKDILDPNLPIDEFMHRRNVATGYIRRK